MNRKALAVYGFIFGIILLLVAVNLYLNGPRIETDEPVTLAVEVVQEPPAPTLQAGPCQQCVGVNCYSASCNLECRHYGTWCETWVMGGGDQPYTQATKAAGGDYAEFFLRRVMKPNTRMEKAGITVGYLITHVNGMYASTDEGFAALVEVMPKGVVLGVMKPDESRVNVTLE